MENPVPVHSSDDIPQPSNKKKYLGLSIFTGFLYGVPTLLIGFVVSFIILIYFTLSFSDLNIPNTVIVGLAVFIGFILAITAGIASGLTSFRHLNDVGTPRLLGYGILSCAGMGLIGLFVFPLLCFLGYFLILRLVEIFNLGNNQFFANLVGGGSESGIFIILIACITPIAIILAYITAILCGGFVYRGLGKKVVNK